MEIYVKGSIIKYAIISTNHLKYGHFKVIVYTGDEDEEFEITVI